MVYDSKENLEKYVSLHPRFALAMDFIKSIDSSINEGKVAIDGDNLFAIVSKYDTKDITCYNAEVHRKYIDIQFLLSGNESIGVANSVDEDKYLYSIEYNSEKDIAFVSNAVNCIIIDESNFAIFFPGEIHQPGAYFAHSSTEVKKVVVKIMA